MFALNQGEICTTPSRILVHEDIADLFIERMQARLKLVKAGNPSRNNDWFSSF
jgi:aldehyde dehydrogenase (NAD+)/aldehyde dehydrogenase